VLDAVDTDAERDHAQVIPEVHPVAHQRQQIQIVQRRGEPVTQRGVGRGHEPPADCGRAQRAGRRLDLLPNRFQPTG